MALKQQQVGSYGKKSVNFQLGDKFEERIKPRGGDTAGSRSPTAAAISSSPSLQNVTTNHSNNYSKKQVKRNISQCCFSIGNLALIIASIIGLAFLIQFIQDEPLYEYGEHLLSLKFYRYLIYITVVLPLVLLVPIFNATSAFFLTSSGSSSSGRYESLGRSILSVKLIYQTLMLILIFLGLIFIGSYIRTSQLTLQIELELRKHMSLRYENPFSYEFMDLLQDEYECCDELWYRANLHDQLPTTCFVPNSNFNLIYDQTCSQAIGSLIGTRCSVIAACLVVILIALCFLVAIDFLDLISLSNGGTYQLDYQSHQPTSGKPSSSAIPAGLAARSGSQSSIDRDADGGSRLGGSSLDNDEQELNLEELEDQRYPLTWRPPYLGSITPSNESSQRSNGLQVRRSNGPKTAATTTPTKSPRDGREADPECAEQGVPLLMAPSPSGSQQQQQQQQQHRGRGSGTGASSPSSLDSDCNQDLARGRPTTMRPTRTKLKQAAPITLTRANFDQLPRDRSQSPVFLGSTIEFEQRPAIGGRAEALGAQQPTARAPASVAATPPFEMAGADGPTTRIKSALKKTPPDGHQHQLHQAELVQLGSSGGGHHELGNGHDDDDENDSALIDDYVERLRSSSSLIRQHRDRVEKQQQQTTTTSTSRRSLLNVRFAE